MTYAHKPGVDHLVVIPAAPWYVLCRDDELNVEDPAALGNETIVVVPCRSIPQAQAVARLLRLRPKTTDVFIADRYPEHRRGRLLVLIDRENADWYEGVRA